MSEIDAVLAQMQISPAAHLPIVAAFCERIGLIGTVNHVVPTEMDVDVGTVMQAMVLDTLSGRSPLYRVADFLRRQDTALLLGREVSCGTFNDTTLGRAMDAIYEAGTEKLFSEVAFQAALRFPLDLRHVHFDTTSVNVWGDYDICAGDGGLLNVTYGKSKDKRPDLKQFLIKLLCVNRNVPILGSCEDGNSSDKSLNNTVLTRISQHMARHGLHEGDFTYIGDCAVVTEDNLHAMGGNLFVTRLPFNYNEADRVVSEAVAEGHWEQVGTLNETPASTKRPPTIYRVVEKTVTLYDTRYRAVVVHSSAHDRRRLKRIDRQIGESEKTLEKILVEETKRDYFCRADAEAAARRLAETGTELHRIEAVAAEWVRYGPGRPARNRPRPVVSVRYVLNAHVEERPGQIQRKRDEAGCFVLLSNVPREGDRARSAADLLRAYKEQHGIERNYSFLKDPLIVNDLFFKKPQRIEALGAILLVSLLIWSLIEHVLRQYLAARQQTLPGWDNKPTERPTAFMMSTKFAGLQVVKIGSTRRLATPLTHVQNCYLAALGLSERIFLKPLAAPG